MKFNINDKVRVRLTTFGRECHRRNYDDLTEMFRARVPKGTPWDYRPPAEDAEGWSEWQLWELMREFGAYLRNGVEVPFETTIDIIDHS
jgi:hypothetical protein